MRELLLELAALGDVVARDDETPNARVGEEVADDSLEPAPRVVSPAHAELQRAVPGRPGGCGECGLDRGPLLGVQELGELGAHQLLGLEAENRLHRRRQVREGAVLVEHRDQVGRVLHERAEARFAAARRALLDQLHALDRTRHLRRQPFQAAHVVGRQPAGGDRDLADATAVADDAEAAAFECGGGKRLAVEHDPCVATDETAGRLGRDLLELLVGSHGGEAGRARTHHVLSLDRVLLQLENAAEPQDDENDEQHRDRDRGQCAEVTVPERLEGIHRRRYESERNESDQPRA